MRAWRARMFADQARRKAEAFRPKTAKVAAAAGPQTDTGALRENGRPDVGTQGTQTTERTQDEART